MAKKPQTLTPFLLLCLIGFAAAGSVNLVALALFSLMMREKNKETG